VSLARGCRLFGISRQSLYQGRRRAARRSQELSQIKLLVLEIRRRMPRLGTRKLYYLLKADFNRLGIKIGRDGLHEYLRSEHLLIKPKKNYTKTTDSKHWLRKYPNLMNQTKARRAEEFFVSDITYIKSREQTHYLALTTDAYSRKIMGYQLSDDLSSENTVKALRMAVKNRLSQKPLIHHSDRGLQYCAGVYQDELRNNQIKPSMTDGYDCYQNALAERINGILKQEFLIETCNTGKELEILIKESIETYNENRPHLSLGMKTPNYIHKKACEENSTGSDKTN
jgi:putative transposase